MRLTLVSHAMTDDMAAARFPSDVPLNAIGRRQLGDVEPVRAERAYCGPELRVRQTAELMSLSDVVTEPRLADLNTAGWQGHSLSDVDPSDLARWAGDPGSAPHGGESVLQLVERVQDWMTALETGPPGRVVAVTSPAVVRATVLVALSAPADSFWRIDVRPAARVTLHGRAGQWTLRC